MLLLLKFVFYLSLAAATNNRGCRLLPISSLSLRLPKNRGSDIKFPFWKRCGYWILHTQMDMITPKEYIGPLMELAQERRGIFKEMKYITESRTSLLYDLPMGEVCMMLKYVSYSVKPDTRGFWAGTSIFPELLSSICELVMRDLSSFQSVFYVVDEFIIHDLANLVWVFLFNSLIRAVLVPILKEVQ